MTQRTILVAQAAYFLNLLRKFMMSPMIRKTKLRIQNGSSSCRETSWICTDQFNLSSAELEIQSMMDVSIHQEDLAVQRTPLIDLVILMVTEKTASIPIPKTTQAHVQMCSTSCWKDISKRSLEVLVGARKTETDKRLLQRTISIMDPVIRCTTLPSHSDKDHPKDSISFLMEFNTLLSSISLREILLKMNLPDHRSVLTDPEDQAKMEMETPRSSGVNSPPNAHT
ncbi:hypothetical protein Tco_1482494 [Tanacetum coccineum]